MCCSDSKPGLAENAARVNVFAYRNFGSASIFPRLDDGPVLSYEGPYLFTVDFHCSTWREHYPETFVTRSSLS